MRVKDQGLQLVLFIVISLLLMTQVTVPQTLEVKGEDIENLPYFNSFLEAFNLTDEEISLLMQNRFVVLNKLGTDDVLDAYRYYWINDLPVFVTTDTMLQVWHLIFDTILEQSEEEILYPILAQFVTNTAECLSSSDLNTTSDDLPYLDALIYTYVAAKIVDPSVNIPLEVYTAVTTIHQAIQDEITIFDAISEFKSKLTTRFLDDFSQYKPRGHYTKSEALKNYFRLYKWLSRIPFYFDDYPGVEFLKRPVEEIVRSSTFLVWAMKNISVSWKGNIIQGFDIWDGFKNFLNGIIGKTYAVTPRDVDTHLTIITRTTEWHPNQLLTTDIESLRSVILSDDTIPSPRSVFLVDALVPYTVASPKAMVLFGEALCLDTWALNQLVLPYVNNRSFPTGLDFASTVLGSERAEELLPSYYQEQRAAVRRELNNWTVEDKDTITFQWMETLSTLTVTPDTLYGSTGYIPNFLQSGAWLDEKLTTVLGSWAQLKHDTILYAQQGITSTLCSTPEGYIEPYPQFYSALLNLGMSFQRAIIGFETSGFDLSAFASLQVFDLFTENLAMLEQIAFHELQGIILTQEEKDFIKDTYSENRQGSGLELVSGWLARTLLCLKEDFATQDSFPNSRASLIADIHTDLNERKALEVATGIMEHLIVIVPGFNGENILTAGPVFSYYEFLTPLDKRMTDEEWRGIIEARLSGSLPEENYNVFKDLRGFWAQSYMVSTEMTVSTVNHGTTDAFEAPQWFKDGTVEEFTSPYQSDLYKPPSNHWNSDVSTPSHVIPAFSFGYILLAITSVIIIQKWRKNYRK